MHRLATHIFLDTIVIIDSIWSRTVEASVGLDAVLIAVEGVSKFNGVGFSVSSLTEDITYSSRQ